MPKFLIPLAVILIISSALGGFLYLNFKDLPTIPEEEAEEAEEAGTSEETAEAPEEEEPSRDPAELQAAIQAAYDRLHTNGSGQHIRDNFPDIRLTYTDQATGSGFPQFILPFRYYYSAEADLTFSICEIDLTVFICEGELGRLFTQADIDSGRCKITAPYLTDKRLQ